MSFFKSKLHLDLETLPIEVSLFSSSGETGHKKSWSARSANPRKLPSMSQDASLNWSLFKIPYLRLVVVKEA